MSFLCFDALFTVPIRDTTSGLAHASVALHRAHPLPNGSPPDAADVLAVRRAAIFVTRRAASLLAAGVHAMWSLHRSSYEADYAGDRKPGARQPSSFACNGSVIERYPGFRKRVQSVVGELVAAEGASGREPPPAVLLHVAEESAIFGAAVAVACERDNWQ
jgi:hexokinase